MKITAQEEYGLRILIRIGNCRDAEGMSIPQISEAEGLSRDYVAKLTRLLRMEGFINSTAGYKGGYILASPANEININKVLKALGGALFNATFCGDHPGALKLCINSTDCSTRSLWQMVQSRVDQLLDQVSLSDLMHPEIKTGEILHQLVHPM